MRISSKGKYALAAMIIIAQETAGPEMFTAIGLSKRLGISKIYLEQVFALLRRGELLTATKGARGGYALARAAAEISAADILATTETALFDEPESAVKETQPGIERVLFELLFIPANKALKEVFARAPLSDLAEEAFKANPDHGYAYCI